MKEDELKMIHPMWFQWYDILGENTAGTGERSVVARANEWRDGMNKHRTKGFWVTKNHWMVT
jgi:hypothetical protein